MERRKRKKPVRVDANGAPRRVLWFEEWADGEALRRTTGVIDPSVSRIDRLHQAAYDFKDGRSLSQNQEVNHLWDRWRLYIGLITGMQHPASRKKTAAIRDALAAAAEAPTADDEDEEDEMPNARPPKEASIVVAEGENAPAQRIQPSEPKPGVTEEVRELRREYYREVRDTKMDRFLNDPEAAVKIFLTGYYRDRGMSFSEKMCRDGPILLAFFLNFLIRNRVFPESEKDLRKAVAVTEQAKKELPQSFVISRAIPDDFSRGCEMIFGTMTNSDAWRTQGDAASGDEDERDAKRQKTENVEETAILQQAAGATKIEVITPETVREMEQDAAEVVVDTAPTNIQDTSTAEAGGWGAAPADDNATAAPSWGEMNAEWGAPQDPSIWDTTPKTNAVHAYLGPTVFPLTHTTGIIERSTRRVKAIIHPSTPHTKGAKAKGSKTTGGAPEPDPEGVERELEARLTQVVLAPWHEWDAYDKADVTKPLILADSRGPAVREENGPPVPTPADADTPVHDPFHDEITLLIEPAAAEKLLPGTGLEATWVQLARADPGVPMEVDAAPSIFAYARRKARLGGPGAPGAPTRFWYMEQVLAVLPSFHMEMVPLPTTEEVFGEDA
ncbi:hypothetical protein BC628DRAFT_1407181 [Trametes gibbosa]|nr:hypothetical protein BC628DRAFT_1407181 [Trametes gibbosa]